jgi:hypothetical protein
MLLTLCLWLVTAQGAQAQFLSAAPDVPLAAGLRELDDATLIFDKPQGRIIEMVAIADSEKGQISPRAIEAFYRASLPNLGWQVLAQTPTSNGLTFARKGEILRLTVTLERVVFRLAPL